MCRGVESEPLVRPFDKEIVSEFAAFLRFEIGLRQDEYLKGMVLWWWLGKWLNG